MSKQRNPNLVTQVILDETIDDNNNNDDDNDNNDDNVRIEENIYTKNSGDSGAELSMKSSGSSSMKHSGNFGGGGGSNSDRSASLRSASSLCIGSLFMGNDDEDNNNNDKIDEDKADANGEEIEPVSVVVTSSSSPARSSRKSLTTSLLPIESESEPESDSDSLSEPPGTKVEFNSALRQSNSTTNTRKEKMEKFMKKAKTRSSLYKKRHIDFLKDMPKTMTYSRRLALYLMTHYHWYNPRLRNKSTKNYNEVNKEMMEINFDQEAVDAEISGDDDDDNGPSLERAWAYFEHVTLPRHLLEHQKYESLINNDDSGSSDSDDDNNNKQNFVMRFINKTIDRKNRDLHVAEPGEDDYPTKLYNPRTTPLDQMGDFGVGVGLYFATLRAITVITLLAGLLNIPNMIFYNSDEYSEGQEGVPWYLKGSAVCTQQSWVPCPNCTRNDFSQEEDYRFVSATSVIATTSTTAPEELNFALKNDCGSVTVRLGYIHFFTTILIILGMLCMQYYLERKRIIFREDEETSSDYSIVIENPPRDAKDPEEWRDFFQQKNLLDNDHMTCCTIAIDNDHLVKALVKRREIFQAIKRILAHEGKDQEITFENMDELKQLELEVLEKRNTFQRMSAILFHGIPEHYKNLTKLNSTIEDLVSHNYSVTNVYVTFESQTVQRKILSALTVPKFAAQRNHTDAVSNQDYLFRGQHVLAVREPNEPSSVRWQDLNETLMEQLRGIAISTITAAATIVIAAIIVALLRRKRSTTYAAISISVFNLLFPLLAKVLTNQEIHRSEGEKQTSLYIKIAVFRFVNTAIIFTIITPFTSTIMPGNEHLLDGIFSIFVSELIIINFVQLCDFVGNFKRHYLAPRAKTQERMNWAMKGSGYELAERYTNMTKIFFLTVWYSSVFPVALFLCPMILFINYFTDRFSLMRTWRPAPKVGPIISEVNRKYFFPATIVAMAIVSAYFWSGFGYDNLCLSESNPTELQLDGIWEFSEVPFGYEDVNVIVVDSTTDIFSFCDQDMIRYSDPPAFPPIPRFQPSERSWMTDSQERLLVRYGWMSLGVLIGVCLIYIYSFLKSIVIYFRGKWKEPPTRPSPNKFSAIESTNAYIPEVRSPIFSYPLIACPVGTLGETELFGWEDPYKPYKFYDLVEDAKNLIQIGERSEHNQSTLEDVKRAFSTVAYWAAPDSEGAL